jgi:hypothetical protein
LVHASEYRHIRCRRQRIPDSSSAARRRPGKADDDQDTTGSHEASQPEKSFACVHVMQRSYRADQLEALRDQVDGAEVPDDVPDVTGLGMIPAAPDARLVPVQANDFGDPASTQLAGEFTGAAADVEREPRVPVHASRTRAGRRRRTDMGG